MMRKPSEMKLNTGHSEIRQLRPTATSTTARTSRERRKGGSTMAMNMP